MYTFRKIQRKNKQNKTQLKSVYTNMLGLRQRADRVKLKRQAVLMVLLDII